MTDDEFLHASPTEVLQANSSAEELFTFSQTEVVQQVAEHRAEEFFDELRSAAEHHYRTTGLCPPDIHGVELLLEQAGFDVHGTDIIVVAPAATQDLAVMDVEVFRSPLLAAEAFGVHPEVVVEHPSDRTKLFVADGNGVVHVEVHDSGSSRDTESNRTANREVTDGTA